MAKCFFLELLAMTLPPTFSKQWVLLWVKLCTPYPHTHKFSILKSLCTIPYVTVFGERAFKEVTKVK